MFCSYPNYHMTRLYLLPCHKERLLCRLENRCDACFFEQRVNPKQHGSVYPSIISNLNELFYIINIVNTHDKAQFKSKFTRLISPLVLSSYTSTSGISFSTKRYSSMITNRLNQWVEKQSLFEIVNCCCALCSPVDSLSINLWTFSCTCQSSVTPRAGEVSNQATAECSSKQSPSLAV